MRVFIDQFLILYSWIILARVLLSWIVRDPRNPVAQFLAVPTEPLLVPLRKILPPEKLGGLDISPIFAYVAIQFVRGML